MCFIGFAFNYLLTLIFFYIVIIKLWLFFICITICFVAIRNCLNTECNININYYYYYPASVWSVTHRQHWHMQTVARTALRLNIYMRFVTWFKHKSKWVVYRPVWWHYHLGTEVKRSTQQCWWIWGKQVMWRVVPERSHALLRGLPAWSWVERLSSSGHTSMSSLHRRVVAVLNPWSRICL